MKGNDRPEANISFIFQQRDNRGTVIDADPRMKYLYPNETIEQIERRVKIESVMVKVHGAQVNDNSIFAKWFGGGTHDVVVILDGNAFVAEFPLDRYDAAGRRSAIVIFGYLPLNSYADREVYRLRKFMVAAMRAQPIGTEEQRFIRAVDAIKKLKPATQRRPTFTAIDELNKSQDSPGTRTSDLVSPELSGAASPVQSQRDVAIQPPHTAGATVSGHYAPVEDVDPELASGSGNRAKSVLSGSDPDQNSPRNDPDQRIVIDSTGTAVVQKPQSRSTATDGGKTAAAGSTRQRDVGPNNPEAGEADPGQQARLRKETDDDGPGVTNKPSSQF